MLCLIVGLVVVFFLGYSLRLGSNQARGFSLPPGDSAAGYQAFVDLRCSNCHSVFGEEAFSRPPEYADLLVPLGGEVRVVKTYGELVTAIIHPSESIRPDVHRKYVTLEGKSIMPDYTNLMTTRQLIDLVTYLQEHYKVVIPQQPTNYYPYGVDLAP
ncbi:MAG TPA: hypothetical protein VK995_04930 [Oceanipulchritudo sp.]|nr:hypothetical protein [Oceanipulchritudo sp.]